MLEIRHPLSGPSPIFERVALQLRVSYRKAVVEYDRAKAAIWRLKRQSMIADLPPEAQADIDRFGRFFQ